MIKRFYLLLLVAVMCISLTACTIPQNTIKEPQATQIQSLILIDTDTLKVVTEGNSTQIHDHTTSKVHTITKSLKRKTKGSISYEANCIINTDTLKVNQYKGSIIIIDKTTDVMYLI